MFAAGPSFFYRRLASPLHAARAGVSAAWALALTVAALVLFQPLVLLVLTAAVLGAGVGAGVGRQLARTLRTAAIVAVPIVAINVLVAREGLTVFVRLGDLGPFGQGDLTVEALVYGLVIALKVTLLILITTLAGLAIDPDELLKGLRRLSFRSALTASLCTRMIPLLYADGGRLAEAQRTRPGGAATGARARAALLGAVVGGSLDRAMDVAATLELRGFAAARPAPRRWLRTQSLAPRAWRRPLGAGEGGRPVQTVSARAGHPSRRWSRHDIAFACSAFAIVAFAALGKLAGWASFQAYPLVHMPITAGTLVLCAGLCTAILMPFADRLGIEP
jgi:energy-coupling factor transport system permease protein